MADETEQLLIYLTEDHESEQVDILGYNPDAILGAVVIQPRPIRARAVDCFGVWTVLSRGQEESTQITP